eukprot:11277654-Heterocapsa_arctica.AAC.1
MPEWRDDPTLHTFKEQLLAWERRVISYEASVGAPMPDSYKCAEGHPGVPARSPHVPHPGADLRCHPSCGA